MRGGVLPLRRPDRASPPARRRRRRPGLQASLSVRPGRRRRSCFEVKVDRIVGHNGPILRLEAYSRLTGGAWTRPFRATQGPPCPAARGSAAGPDRRTFSWSKLFLRRIQTIRTRACSADAKPAYFAPRSYEAADSPEGMTAPRAIIWISNGRSPIWKPRSTSCPSCRQPPAPYHGRRDGGHAPARGRTAPRGLCQSRRLAEDAGCAPSAAAAFSSTIWTA